jgi:trigger factor
MTEITYETTAEDVASRALHVTVPMEKLEAAERKAVRQYAGQARLPGFRKGHAPEAVVRRRFESEIRQWILEESLRESWQKILDESGLKPVADPQVRNVSFVQGQPLTFDLMIEVRPEITLSTVGGFTLERTQPQVTEAMVKEQLDQIREQRATWNPLDDVQPKPGHLVSVTVETLEEGKEPTGGKPHSLVLGQGSAIPELEEQIMALKPGNTVEADVRFPEDHAEESRRGTARKVRITLHEVKEQFLPPLDDSLAREVGEFDSVAALETAVKADLANEAVRTAEQGVREQLIAKLAEANNVPAPESLVHRLIHAYAEAYRIDKAQFETFASSFHSIAESQVRRELVLEAVSSAQKLQATEADLDARIAEMAAARGTEPGKLYASLEQAKRLGELERAITEEKTFTWLLGQSTVHEVAA